MDAAEFRNFVEGILAKYSKPAVYYLCKQADVNTTGEQMETIANEFDVSFVAHDDSILMKTCFSLLKRQGGVTEPCEDAL